MQNNQSIPQRERNQQAAPASTQYYEQHLRRMVVNCMLWEDHFYKTGFIVDSKIEGYAQRCNPAFVAALAVEARCVFELRYVPLLLLDVLARIGRGSSLVQETMGQVMTRAEDMCDLVSIHNRHGPQKLSAQMKKGIARAFNKFDAEQLIAANKMGTVTLRNVMFLAHPKPRDAAQAALWKQLANGTLPGPDKWEVNRHRIQDKAATYTRLLHEGRVTYPALLRNLPEMIDVGVEKSLIKQALLTCKGAENISPFRYVSAIIECPAVKDVLSTTFYRSLKHMPSLLGRTVVYIDYHGRSSRGRNHNEHLGLPFRNLAATLAGSIGGDVSVFQSIDGLHKLQPARGWDGIKEICNTGFPDWSKKVERTLDYINRSISHDRLIVCTAAVKYIINHAPLASKAYVIDLTSPNKWASKRNGWIHISGFSENVLRYIHAVDQL